MRQPFVPVSRATQQVICRMELMLTRISMILAHLPVNQIYILNILLLEMSYLKIRDQ